jgi:PAS domain S-box-containing protein
MPDAKDSEPGGGEVHVEPCSVCGRSEGFIGMEEAGDEITEDLSEILDTKALQSILDSFQALTGAAFAILDLKGRVLVAAGWTDICTRFHRTHPETARNCAESDVFLTNNVRQGAWVSYKCKNHLWDVVTPLCVGGKHLGNVFAGQFFYDDEGVDEDFFARQADSYGFDKKEYLAALGRVPRFSRERVRHVMDFLVKMAELVSMLSLRNARLNRTIALQKQVEQSLRESEERFRTLLRYFPLPASVRNDKDEFVYLNDRFISTFGYTLGDIPTMAAWWERAFPDPQRRREAVATRMAAPIRRENDLELSESREFQVTKKNGTTIPVDIFSTKIGDLTLTGFMDATVRKQAIKEILDFMPSALIGLDSQRRVTHWNRSAAELFGKAAASVMNQPIFTVVPMLSKYSDLIGAARHEHRLARMENIFADGQGGPRTVDILLYPIVSPDGSGVVIRIDDVSERVRMEEMIIQTEKMVSVGQLAAGMAHELNNPLAGILQSAQVLTKRLSEDTQANRDMAMECGCAMENIRRYQERRQIPDMIGGILNLAQRAAGIVGDMMDFSQKTTPGKVPVDANRLFDSAMELLSSDHDLTTLLDGRGIQLLREYEPDLPRVSCSKSQLRQALVNLIRNAFQALKGPRETPLPPTITLRTSREGDMVRLEVEDNGCGMEEEVRRKAFDPFFSTRPTGEGTGLGLPVAYYIVVNNHHGTLRLESEPGKGTRAVLCLPLKQ